MVSNLSAREQELIVLSYECFKSEPQVCPRRVCDLCVSSASSRSSQFSSHFNASRISPGTSLLLPFFLAVLLPVFTTPYRRPACTLLLPRSPPFSSSPPFIPPLLPSFPPPHHPHPHPLPSLLISLTLTQPSRKGRLHPPRRQSRSQKRPHRSNSLRRSEEETSRPQQQRWQRKRVSRQKSECR